MLSAIPAAVQLFINKGNNDFNEPVQISTVPNPNDRSDPYAIHAGELNRDGKPDLIIVNSQFVHYPNEVSVLLNNGNGGFNAAIQISLNRAAVIGVADVNGDGARRRLHHYTRTPGRGVHAARHQLRQHDRGSKS